MKLTNEEKQKIFSTYLGCEYVALDEPAKVVTWKTLYYLVKHKIPKVNRLLLLTPLSKISDEHAIEVANVYTGNVHGYGKAANDELIKAGKQTVGRIIDKYSNYVNTMDFVFAYHQLILKSYAVPLYFGVNHPCNGLTAIELEIAIDKTLLTLPV